MIAEGNPASRKVAERAGFAEEGTLRGAIPIPGGRADTVVYGLLIGEL